MDNYWMILLGMASITYSCRYLFFIQTVPFELGEKTKKILGFTAPSVLTAMWVPIVFLSDQTGSEIILNSPFLIAGVLTIALSVKLKNTLLIVAISMGIFSTLKFII